MNLKKFLRPNISKTLITLTLLLFLGYASYYLGAYSIVCESCPDSEHCPPCVAPDIGMNYLLKNLGPSLILSYLISCLIVELSQKFR